MANINVLVASVNNLHSCSDYTYKWCENVAVFRRRKLHSKRTKCHQLSSSSSRRSWRLCAATELRFVRDSTGKNSDNVPTQIASIEIPVTCYQVYTHRSRTLWNCLLLYIGR